MVFGFCVVVVVVVVTVVDGEGGGAAVVGSSLMQRGKALLHWPEAKQLRIRGPSKR